MYGCPSGEHVQKSLKCSDGFRKCYGLSPASMKVHKLKPTQQNEGKINYKVVPRHEINMSIFYIT
jgi:hypothetical protein